MKYTRIFPLLFLSLHTLWACDGIQSTVSSDSPLSQKGLRDVLHGSPFPILEQDGNTYPPHSTHVNAALTPEYVMNAYWYKIKADPNQAVKNAALRKIVNLNFISNEYPLLMRYIAGGLRAGGDPNKVLGPHFSSILRWAVVNENYELCKLILECGGNPDIVDAYCFTPLASATTRAIAELLVNHGAHIRPFMVVESVCSTDYESAVVEFYMQQEKVSLAKNTIRETALTQLIEPCLGSARICNYDNEIPALLEKIEALFEEADHQEIATAIKKPLKTTYFFKEFPDGRVPTIFFLSYLAKKSNAAAILAQHLQAYVNIGVLDRLRSTLPIQQTIEEECSICQEHSTNVSLRSCKHQFCIECLTRWRAHRNTCPLCRVVIVKK